jgi:hypothetical protein
MPHNTPMRISAKNLGILALPDCCERCFWMRAHLAWKSPWAIMPGIFSSIDGFSKRAILASYEKTGHFPPWIAGRWAEARPLPTPHHSTFRLTDPATGIVLTGVPDLMLGFPNRRLAILDLKTARFSKHQDFLLPMYQIQLVGYAMIAEGLGMGLVEALGLVYGEPPANDDNKGLDTLVGDQGFSMPFKATAEPVELDRSIIPPLLKRAKAILEMEKTPAYGESCKECELVREVARISGRV